MKVIFLDFDGVLNSTMFAQCTRCSFFGEDDGIDRAAVARLNRIIAATSADVVVSSAWRVGRSVADLARILALHGFTGTVIGKTTELMGARGHEIQQWLSESGVVDSFVILDDDSDMVHLAPWLVQTSHVVGLTDADADRAIAMLNSEQKGGL